MPDTLSLFEFSQNLFLYFRILLFYYGAGRYTMGEGALGARRRRTHPNYEKDKRAPVSKIETKMMIIWIWIQGGLGLATG